MAYTPNTPNAYDTNLIPLEVRSEYFKETLLLSPLTLFMGNSPLSVIQVRNLNDGSGLTTDFAFSKNIDYKNPIIGYDQISGKGALMEFYTDRVQVNQQAIPDKLYGAQLTKLTTPVDVYNRMKPLLQDAHNQNLVFSLCKAATIDSYPATGVMPTLAAPLTGPRTNRYVYGNNRVSDNSVDAGVNAMVTAGPGTNAAPGDGLSVRHIRKLRNMAIYGGAFFEQEKRITPYKLQMEQGFSSPYYVYFMDTPSYESLEQDADWAVYNGRGFKEMANQPTALSGAFFKGQIDNVLVYEVPELGNFQVTSAGAAITASWNLFCGAEAFGLVWAKEPWFTQEWSNHNTVVEQAIIEIRGQKALMFPSFNPTLNAPGQPKNVVVENGIIHSFVRLN